MLEEQKPSTDVQKVVARVNRYTRALDNDWVKLVAKAQSLINDIDKNISTYRRWIKYYIMLMAFNIGSAVVCMWQHKFINAGIGFFIVVAILIAIVYIKSKITEAKGMQQDMQEIVDGNV